MNAHASGVVSRVQVPPRQAASHARRYRKLFLMRRVPRSPRHPLTSAGRTRRHLLLPIDERCSEIKLGDRKPAGEHRRPKLACILASLHASAPMQVGPRRMSAVGESGGGTQYLLACQSLMAVRTPPMKVQNFSRHSSALGGGDGGGDSTSDCEYAISVTRPCE